MKTLLRRYPQLVTAALLCCIFLAAFVYLVRDGLLNRPYQYSVLSLDADWQVERDGEMLPEHTVSQINTGTVERGTRYKLTRTLPANTPHPSGCLYFRSIHCAVTVRLDGEVIYTFGEDRFAENRFIGRYLCFVPLPDGYDGRELTVELTAAQKNAFYGLGPFTFGTELDLTVAFLKGRIFPFFIGTFLCIFGIIQMFWLPLLLWEDRTQTKLIFTSLTTFILGSYLLGYHNLFDLFTDMPNVNTILEYISLYMVPTVMAGYIYSVTSGRMRRAHFFFLLFDLIFVSSALILHALNLVHITRFLLFSYALDSLEATPFMLMVLRGWGKRRKTHFDRLEEMADRSIAYGFAVYVVTSFTDILIFNYVRFSGGQESTVPVPFVTAGSLFYALAICMHYFLHGVVHLRTEATRQALRDKAYSDPLTGLSNRGECDLVLERLSRAKQRYVIINMDLDRLKQVNDTLGHAEGDRMLKGFADILRESYEGAELIGRMGGDEFVVILKGADCDRAEDLTVRMLRAIDRRNATEQAFRYSASYGIAKSWETGFGRRGSDIYMRADARMYDMKRRRHEDRSA